MTKKFHILLIILIIGFFTTPTLTYACGTKSTTTEKSCCKKIKTDKTDPKGCCKKNINQKDNYENDCDGKCGHSSCSCPNFHYAFVVSFWAELRAKTYFTESKKTKNHYSENYLSDGFTSIWKPPNIG